MNLKLQDVQVEKERKWKLFTVTNENGMEVKFLNFGGIITEICVPDRKGKLENVVLSYKNYEDYLTNEDFLGALIGRVAGRIKGAAFQIDDERYALEANDGNHHLHGGSNGFHHVLWKAEPFKNKETAGVEFTYLSEDGESGYPGPVELKVTYSLNEENQFIIDYEAKSDQSTPLTLTNHAYFNLAGNAKNTIHHHQVNIDSSSFAELDEDLIPTGKLLEVDDTPFDFRKERDLREGIESSSHQNLVAGGGYDHYFIFAQQQQDAVVVKDRQSGRVMKVRTNQPGMVMYTSNNLNEAHHLAEGKSQKHLGVCLETQGSPASLHEQGFPEIMLNPEEVYKKQTVFAFEIENL
ncbi:galactose mutarotase [Halobacillus salinarum]|uniref:Aldose 1-epimerase n=1 Tax=Halobacillus salinarum TaxID=2932257 RepID=A0ABY4EHU0_9BACI|nr:aldose epimerase family protein [Halobacillus salinarum]UOQ43199.1 galactose mutarotase [Halobacillus salinarum]